MAIFCSKKSRKQQAEAELVEPAPLERETVEGELVDEPGEGKKKCGRCRRLRRLVLLSVIAAVIALVVSEDARKIALDALFGAEEEFEYTAGATVSGNGAG